MRYLPIVLKLLAWYAAGALAVWALWTHGHEVWACIVALLVAGSTSPHHAHPGAAP